MLLSEKIHKLENELETITQRETDAETQERDVFFYLEEKEKRLPGTLADLYLADDIEAIKCELQDLVKHEAMKKALGLIKGELTKRIAAVSHELKTNKAWFDEMVTDYPVLKKSILRGLEIREREGKNWRHETYSPLASKDVFNVETNLKRIKKYAIEIGKQQDCIEFIKGLKLNS